jgi:hypothetical protein
MGKRTKQKERKNHVSISVIGAPNK